MKRARLAPRRPEPRSFVQYFSYGPYEFNVNKALALAADSRKYQPVMCRPRDEWIAPFIEIDQDYVERCDLSKPVLFATVLRSGQLCRILIDGNHRVAKALSLKVEVPIIVLDQEDTRRVLVR